LLAQGPPFLQGALMSVLISVAIASPPSWTLLSAVDFFALEVCNGRRTTLYPIASPRYCLCHCHEDRPRPISFDRRLSSSGSGKASRSPTIDARPPLRAPLLSTTERDIVLSFLHQPHLSRHGPRERWIRARGFGVVSRWPRLFPFRKRLSRRTPTLTPGVLQMLRLAQEKDSRIPVP